ncbi:hypothetical protein CONPUDRAFT_155357 [Coniophora puteana RWD-64-598 SS2]|uniref:Uncharacterized protein n=1 Tax=Coniophora puteana (strain RWD-64-598) TaxID=741705 RepID=A0A5M3MLV8_CONPW|nr:uncharacterized protein CONPUDRAFT_155357 [Coniophora puteana RWD-64-598 SS2]EIW79970.1 hypothetical protein CONPUDRAFT_155357 [Coniophora puteana RWD-64-598 SS2]
MYFLRLSRILRDTIPSLVSELCREDHTRTAADTAVDASKVVETRLNIAAKVTRNSALPVPIAIASLPAFMKDRCEDTGLRFTPKSMSPNIDAGVFAKVRERSPEELLARKARVTRKPNQPRSRDDMQGGDALEVGGSGVSPARFPSFNRLGNGEAAVPEEAKDELDDRESDCTIDDASVPGIAKSCHRELGYIAEDGRNYTGRHNTEGSWATEEVDNFIHATETVNNATSNSYASSVNWFSPSLADQLVASGTTAYAQDRTNVHDMFVPSGTSANSSYETAEAQLLQYSSNLPYASGSSMAIPGYGGNLVGFGGPTGISSVSNNGFGNGVWLQHQGSRYHDNTTVSMRSDAMQERLAPSDEAAWHQPAPKPSLTELGDNGVWTRVTDSMLQHIFARSQSSMDQGPTQN